MDYIRKHSKCNFTQISNTIINDEKISFKAKGIFLYLWSKPEKWVVRITDICNNGQEGKTAIYSGLNELEENGYIARQRYYVDGKIAGINYNLYDDKKNDSHTESLSIENLNEDNQSLENQSKDNQPYSNTKTLEININSNSDQPSRKNYSQTEVDAIIVSKYLYSTITSFNQTFKGNYESWTKDIEKAIRIDLRTKEQLMNCINWIYNSKKGEFWIPNILSGKKLREKFDTMNTQSMNDKSLNMNQFIKNLCGNTNES